MPSDIRQTHRHGWFASAFVVAFAAPLLAGEAAWQQPYGGSDATGDQVIALWHFDAPEQGRDSSGRGHDLKLRGQSRFVPDGRFGGCLESFAADRDHDTPQGALAANHPSLSPQGPFTIEMWFRAKPEMDQYANVFLLDKKYYHYPKDLPQANWDYCLYMRRTGPNQRRLVAYLGFGDDSAAFSSRTVTVEPGRWYHVAFTYDGAGTGRWFVDGQCVGRGTHEGRGAIAPGKYPLVIGCRYGSIHEGFPGYIDEVRICRGIVPYFAGSLELDASRSRKAFLRMENGAAVLVTVINDTGKPLDGGRLHAVFEGQPWETPLPGLAPGAQHTIAVHVDSTLRPGGYRMQVSASAHGQGKTYHDEKAWTVTIVPRPLPYQMPVVLWGSGDLETVREIGFTHQLVSLVDYARVWSAEQPGEAVSSARQAELTEILDQYLIHGIGAVATLAPGRWVMSREELKQKYQRIDRQGRPYSRENVCARFPEIQAFAYRTGAAVAKTFGHFPALQAALIHTEVRDGTNLCFHEHDREAFRRFAGFDIPAQAASKHGVSYANIPDLPEDRIIPDDHPLLVFYRWFWKEGDGWNELHSRVHRGLKSTGRDDLWTFFDPAVRVPSVWGSGGEVDVISQWTYSYPDPIKIGQAADELFAMADGRPGQRVMKMTQIIWYRSQTAPQLPEEESARADWERQQPDARFITIAPDHLREAFWSKVSRPVQGIMYHGWGSLVPAPHGSYRFTNPETRPVLAQLIRDVVRPLGPTLMQVPDRRADIALLESFAAQMFAGRGTYGWSHRWEADLHLILQWAHLQPRIIYDETILRDGLDAFRVLAVPNGDVLTESVARAIADFQKHGGILLADEHLAPALRPDILVRSYQRTGKADEDKAALQAKAAELRQQLDPLYRRYGDTSDPDVIPRFRQYQTTDYLFLVNDKRTFGHYVGHHGKVMEQGLPNSARVTVRRSGGHVYDLVRHQPVVTQTGQGAIQFDVRLGPGGGGVYMITSQPLDQLRIETPAGVPLGESAVIRVSITGPDGAPLDAIVPVHVEILDPQGRPAEFSGYYGAKDGKLEIPFEPARNDQPGLWSIRATELASGKTKTARISVSTRTGGRASR